MKMTILIFSLFSMSIFGQCLIENASQAQLNDSLAKLLKDQGQCPNNVFEFKNILEKEGLTVSTAMVANRGFHNPEAGSFSLFESVSGLLFGAQVKKGHFFFGHFTQANSKVLDFDQKPRPGKLMIEAIVWDNQKKFFNFYELIGTQSAGQWFYRGDSKDALTDNLNLHLQKDPANPKFGNTMRCSACHTSGGPIMKELEAPFNDWWTQNRKLSFASNTPTKKLQREIEGLIDASEFSDLVKSGIKELEQSSGFNIFKESLSLRQQLKPLFCTVEVNLISDKQPLDSPMVKLNIVSTFWINPFLLQEENIELDKQLYIETLKKFNFSFPEIARLDADHAWISPVKSFVDNNSIQSLIDKNIITEEFALDVLALDMASPLFSKNRCQLLKEIPTQLTKDWLLTFKENLAQSKSAVAKQLLENLNIENKQEHKKKAKSLMEQIQDTALSKEGMEKLVIGLHQSRISVFQSEISKNPMGQILEPGFRVIFPLPN